MLSQSEIDALLSGALEIEEDAGNGSVNLAEIMGQGTPASAKEADADKKVTIYNFWSPDRFSKEQMRAVELVHEDLAERLTTSLPSFLRTSMRPRLVHSEQGRFADFLKDFEPNSLFHIITLAPLPGQTILTISPNVSNMILEQRLGGRIEGRGMDRPLTDIDQSLLRGLIEHMLNDIKGAWSKVVTIEPGLEDSTVNQHWVQMMIGNEKVMLLTFEMAIQGATGTMNIYIPFSTLKPISNELNPHVWITGRKDRSLDSATRLAALENLGKVHLPVQVFLGNAELTLRELVNLEEGDIIQLDTAPHQPLLMQIANQKLFKTKIGKLGNHLAVEIVSKFQEDEA